MLHSCQAALVYINEDNKISQIIFLHKRTDITKGILTQLNLFGWGRRLHWKLEKESRNVKGPSVNCEARKSSPSPRAACRPGDFQLLWCLHGRFRTICPLSTAVPSAFHQNVAWAHEMNRSQECTKEIHELGSSGQHHRAHLPYAAFWFWKSSLLYTRWLLYSLHSEYITLYDCLTPWTLQWDSNSKT